ncbi:hypothetical protein, partial [Granulicella sp. L56]
MKLEETESSALPLATTASGDEVEWNLIAAVRKVLRARRVLYICTLIGLGLGLLLALTLPKSYKAEA